MKANWCLSCGRGRNFGDQMAPDLLRHFGYTPEWADPSRAEVFTVGSILSKVPDHTRAVVLGTGFIREGFTKDLRRAHVLALRGPLSARTARLARGAPAPALGDPGVLAPDVYGVGALWDGSGYALAVPHYVDHDLAARHPDAQVASPTDDPLALMAQISVASVVYTSSLHVLIAADALGVPHVLEPHPGVKGGMFKFRDYAGGLDEEIVPGRVRLSDRGAMAAAQERMRQAYWHLGVLFGA